MPTNRREPILLQTATERLLFDRDTGQLVSLRSRLAPGEELLASAEDHPVFVMEYLDERREYRQLDSFRVRRSRISLNESGPAQTLRMEFLGIGGLELDLTATVRASRETPLSRWSFTLRNGAGVEIVHVQFPFVVAAYASGARAGSSAVLWPLFTGLLIRNPTPQALGPDHAGAWQFQPTQGDTAHYPGSLFAQFLACYNERAGLYLACEDTAGRVKRMAPLHREPGIRLGVAHVGDWPRKGRRELGYDVVLGTFQGDWHAAAELYRSWSLKQKWATPLSRRSDVPAWLLDSPPHITIRLQGELDDGPVFPVREFLPYEKCISLLQKTARRVRAPLVAVIMSWERGGPWVYPDCFPPVGGEASLKRFVARARRQGWHVGSFCNGTRWVVGHFWNRYDGREYFRRHNGESSVCRLPSGEAWVEQWDRTWRPSYACCMAAPITRKTATAFVRRLLRWGLESIQFFDQNVGAASFPCFAGDHGHPPVPGRWMTEAMEQMIGEFRRLAQQAGQAGAIQSVEQPCNEYCLPLFQQCDVRVAPPGTDDRFVPLYHFLFHECIVLHGMMSTAPEPYHLPMANAANAVWGEIPGAVMTGDGTLLNRETYNWAPWVPKVGSNDDALEMLRTVTAMRRGPGRDFLVFGRMMPPARLSGIRTIRWRQGRRLHKVPAVFHAAWRAPDDRFAVVLANWTTDAQKVAVADDRLGSSVVIHAAGRRLDRRRAKVSRGRLSVSIPPLGMVLLESGPLGH